MAAGGCPEDHRVHAVVLAPGAHPSTTAVPTPGDVAVTGAYGCRGGLLRSAPTWLGIAATLLIVLLMAAKVNAAVAYGVVFAKAIAWIPGHQASYFSTVPGSPAAARFEDFKRVRQGTLLGVCCGRRRLHITASVLNVCWLPTNGIGDVQGPSASPHVQPANLTQLFAVFVHRACHVCRSCRCPTRPKLPCSLTSAPSRVQCSWAALFGMWYLVFLDSTGWFLKTGCAAAVSCYRVWCNVVACTTTLVTPFSAVAVWRNR